MLRQQYTWTFQIHNSSTTVAIKGSFQHPLIAHAEADAYQGLLLFHDQHTTWRSLVKAAGTIDACKACTRSSAHHLNRRYPGILDAISRLRPLPIHHRSSSSIIVSDSICLHAWTIFIRALAFVEFRSYNARHHFREHGGVAGGVARDISSNRYASESVRTMSSKHERNGGSKRKALICLQFKLVFVVASHLLWHLVLVLAFFDCIALVLLMRVWMWHFHVFTQTFLTVSDWFRRYLENTGGPDSTTLNSVCVIQFNPRRIWPSIQYRKAQSQCSHDASSTSKEDAEVKEPG
jgi:hypothetical protein